MKKSLLALALLGAFTASAFAEPSVTLYGRIDTGLVYTHKNLDNTAGSTDTFSMDSGVTTGSRWGLKGSEDIGNAKVGFVLESGFNSDDGTSGQNNRLFGREAQVNISSAYGTLYAGRLGSIASDNGSLGYLGDVSAFPSAYGFVGNQQGSTGTAYGRYDNTLAYQTPTFGGLQGAIMYSFKGDTKASDSNVADARENSGDADRYLAAGLRYKAGKAAVVLTGDMTMYGNDAKDYGSVDNGYSFVLGGNYDFGVAKAFAKVTYFDNQVNVLDSFDLISDSRDLKKAEALKGWGAELGTNVPAFGGNFLAAVGYRDAKDVDDGSYKFKRWNAAVGYTYAFSKRTNVYGLAGYAQEKANALDRKASGAQVGFGLVHKF
ncbi:outer membrane porin protein [Mesosutterella multiformis]|jgi:predicted porin|uniref:Outer membrane porin protein n=1 Tax=Mesosutterella multiformis TaxID=2259133 RepID=A0A388SDX2_9BURK|nr:porin [Mesosutterella multiformis]GBO92924.1 outer membrane porin protein [Mesosutterella multiformis]